MTVYHKFTFEGTDFILPLRLTLENKERESKSTPGNFQWVNSKVKTIWAADEDAIRESNAEKDEDWKKFQLDGFHRVVREGEVRLLNYIKVLYSDKYDTEADDFGLAITEDDFAKFMKGDVSQLKDVILKELKDCRIRLLVGIDENQRMVFFNTLSKIAQVPYLKAETIPSKKSRWMNFVFDIDRNGDQGSYSWDNNHRFELKPTRMEKEFPDGPDAARARTDEEATTSAADEDIFG